MFRSLLFLNGTLPELEEIPFLNTIPSIAADGGSLRKLLAKGHIPQFVIGDGDSLSGLENLESLKVILDKDQETTDFEKCILYMSKNNLFPSLVYGIGGGEIDHQVNNLHCFVKYSKSHPMIFIDAQKMGFSVRKSLVLDLAMGTTVSILPFPEASVTTQGLRWPLKKERLALLERSGARNKSSETKIKVEVHEGTVLVILDVESVSNVIVDEWTQHFAADVHE